MPIAPALIGKPLSFHSDNSKYGYVLYQGTKCEGAGWGAVCHDEVGSLTVKWLHLLILPLYASCRRITPKMRLVTSLGYFFPKPLVANLRTAVRTSSMRRIRT